MTWRESKGEGSKYGKREGKGAATLAQQLEKAPCDLSRFERCCRALLKLSLCIAYGTSLAINSFYVPHSCDVGAPILNL